MSSDTFHFCQCSFFSLHTYTWLLLFLLFANVSVNLRRVSLILWLTFRHTYLASSILTYPQGFSKMVAPPLLSIPPPPVGEEPTTQLPVTHLLHSHVHMAWTCLLLIPPGCSIKTINQFSFFFFETEVCLLA